MALHPAYPIRTARLVLRPFTETDLDDLYTYQSRPDVTRTCATPHATTPPLG